MNKKLIRIIVLIMAIISGCLLEDLQSQTVDISESIEKDSERDVKDPSMELEAALKIEERDFQTLQKELKSWSGGRVDDMQKSWKRWILSEQNLIKGNNADKKDIRYKDLIQFVHNRSNYLKDIIDEKISRRIFDIQCKSGLRQIENELDAVVGNLEDVLDIVNVAQFPTESNPEDTTKLGQQANGQQSYFNDTTGSNFGKDIITALRNGDYYKTISITKNALNKIDEDPNSDVNTKMRVIIFLEKLNLKTRNLKEANTYNDAAQKIIASNDKINERIKCLAFAYGAIIAFICNEPEKGVMQLDNAVKIFNGYIDTGFPFTDTESPYLCKIIQACIAGFTNKSSLNDSLKQFAGLSGALDRLMESTKDNLVIPSEQCEMDSITVKLKLAQLAYLEKKYDVVIELCNSIHSGEGYSTNLRSNAQFSRENDLYLLSLSLRTLALKNLNQSETQGKTISQWTREWIDNYKKKVNDIMQGASESQKMSLLDNEDPYSFLVNMNDPVSVAELTFFNKGVVLESLFNAKSIISNIGDSKLKNEMSVIDTARSLNQDGSAAYGDKLLSQERDFAEQIRKAYRESDVLEFIKNMNFRSIPVNIPKGSAFIDYIQYTDDTKNSERYYAALVITSKGKVTLKKLDLVKSIDNLIEIFRDLVKQQPNSETDKKIMSVCQELYKSLILPISDQISSCKEIIISPDGRLNFVPFSVFMNSKGEFLSCKLQVRYVSSGRDLLRKTQISSTKDIVILDAPLFTKEQSSTNFVQDVFSALPGTKQESQMLQSIMAKASYNVSVLEGTNASESSIREIKKPRILHIATHGFNLSENDSNNDLTPTRGMKVMGISSTNTIVTKFKSTSNPMFKTGLALYGANNTFQSWTEGKIPDPRNDGILMAGEVPLIDLSNTSLVTLSACQTAEGDAVGGEGVFGLRRGFLQAGAKNILMTLWPIADQETIDIMSEFYKRIAKDDSDPGAVLCDVQAEFLNRLRVEKGVTYAINRAAPFILFSQGRIPSHDGSKQTENLSTSASSPTVDSNQTNQSNASYNSTILEFDDALTKADSGDAYAQAVVSIYYTLGYKTPKDASKGLTYALKSAAQKNPLGIYQVGVFRELGIGVKKDKNQAHKLMSSAFDDLNAMSGDPYALYDLAYLASKGIGVDQNPKEAARLYKASEDLGFSPSKNMPGASMTIEEYPSLIVGKWQPEHGPAWIYQSDGTYTREGTAEHGVYRFAGEKLILDNDPDGGVVDFISKDSFTFKGKREKKWPFVRISN